MLVVNTNADACAPIGTWLFPFGPVVFEHSPVTAQSFHQLGWGKPIVEKIGSLGIGNRGNVSIDWIFTVLPVDRLGCYFKNGLKAGFVRTNARNEVRFV